MWAASREPVGVVLLSCLLATSVRAQSASNINTPSKMLDSLMNNLKGNKLPPNFNMNSPTQVECQIYVDSFDTISESSMDYTASLVLSLTWEDPKLSYASNKGFMEAWGLDFLLEVDYQNINNIWIPELYFPNEKKARFHDVMNPNQMIRVHPNGKLDYFARLSLTLSCPMNLRNYPFDKQECSIRIESFAYDTSKLTLAWALSREQERPVDVSEEIELPQFQVKKLEWKRCGNKELSRGGAGNYSCIEAIFHLERSLQFFLIQMYIPSTLIVIVSWLSFWLNANSVPGRVSLGVLTVLTMTTQSSSVNASLPRVSYLKAIDLWMSTCLVFVFAALSEFAVVNFLSRGEFSPQRKERKPVPRAAEPFPSPGPPTAPASPTPTGPTLGDGEAAGPGDLSHEAGPSSEASDPTSSQETNMEQGALSKQTLVGMDGRTRLFIPGSSIEEKEEPAPFCCTAMLAAAMVDRISRVIFPLLFATFCACYWTYYAYFTESSLSMDALSYEQGVNRSEVEFQDRE